MKINIKLKKILILIQVNLILLVLVSCTSSQVQNTNNETISLELDMEDDLVKISKILTYEDIIDNLMEDENINEIEIEKIIDKDQYNSRTFRIISNYIQVSPNYVAEIKFYCETIEDISNRSIINIFHIKSDSEYNNERLLFNGDVFVHLITDNQIYYLLNGDFYKDGKYIERNEVNIEEGEYTKINISLEDPLDRYYYIHKENYINF
jgi:hypothetical protein